jgi:hypothetical protein
MRILCAGVTLWFLSPSIAFAQAKSSPDKIESHGPGSPVLNNIKNSNVTVGFDEAATSRLVERAVLAALIALEKQRATKSASRRPQALAADAKRVARASKGEIPPGVAEQTLSTILEKGTPPEQWPQKLRELFARWSDQRSRTADSNAATGGALQPEGPSEQSSQAAQRPELEEAHPGDARSPRRILKDDERTKFQRTVADRSSGVPDGREATVSLGGCSIRVPASWPYGAVARGSGVLVTARFVGRADEPYTSCMFFTEHLGPPPADSRAEDRRYRWENLDGLCHRLPRYDENTDRDGSWRGKLGEDEVLCLMCTNGAPPIVMAGFR